MTAAPPRPGGAASVARVADGDRIPRGSGRARDLTRRSTRSRALPETGRMHHLGAAPEWMPLLDAEGRQVGRTRTSDLQLRSRTTFQLERLRDAAAGQMQNAAAGGDYERAAHHRDEVAAVAAELDRRAAAAPDPSAPAPDPPAG